MLVTVGKEQNTYFLSVYYSVTSGTKMNERRAYLREVQLARLPGI